MTSLLGAMFVLLVGAALLLSLASGPLEAQPLVPQVINWETYFRIDWQAEPRNGRVVLSGFIISVNKYGARWMQLLIDGRDERGQLVDQKLVWVPSEFPQGGRAYFEALVAPAADYRVSVFAYEPPPRP
ncbi:MAG: hypothetical protein ACREKS_21300 [Candidatus Rokuibacteriota bacterium]